MRLRLPFLTFALITAVSACGKQDPIADNVTALNLPLPANDTALDPDAVPPENGAVTATALQATATPSAGTIPAALQGRWGLAPGDCNSTRGDAKGLLVINGGELRFYESRAVPSPGVEVRDESIRGNFEFTGEGQSWTRFERFERNGSHLVRTESNPAASYTYAKC